MDDSKKRAVQDTARAANVNKKSNKCLTKMNTQFTQSSELYK